MAQETLLRKTLIMAEDSHHITIEWFSEAGLHE